MSAQAGVVRVIPQRVPVGDPGVRGDAADSGHYFAPFSGWVRQAAGELGGPVSPLGSLSRDIRGALKPGGLTILSGLLRTQERFVKAAYLARGFRLERRLHRDAWATLVLRKG